MNILEQQAEKNAEMHVELMYPSKYLKAADFKGKDVTLTIKKVVADMLTTTGGAQKFKYVVSFKESDKMLALNITNARLIAVALKEPKAVNWAGNKITLYPTTCDAFGEIKDCIRVRKETK